MTLRPRTDEIVNSVLWSFEELVVPELEDPYAVSVAHTIVNLLRHVALRVELEPPALFAGNQELRALLGEVAAYARASGSSRLAGIPPDVQEALDASADGASGYPSASRLADDATTLRWALDRSIRALQDARADLGGTDGYAEVRRRIREVIARQLEREATWVVPAFSGVRR